MKKKLIIWGVILAVVAVGVIVFLNVNKPELIMNTAVAQSGTVETSVMATGYIQPVEEVEVGTQVSGVIEKIYVDFNSHVTAGQLLAELDRSTLEERLIQAKASLASAQSELLLSEQNYNRIRQLHDAKAATDVSLEEAVNRLEQARMSLQNANADANQAQVNRDYAFIYSPINGVVLDRQVNVGQTVASSFSTPTLFTIAEDLTKMQVEVDVDEADIGQVRVGQRAVFTVDAYSGDDFEGTVQQIRLQPVVTNNVVTYTVIVEAPNPEEKLFPGMTANITIYVDAESGVTVPLAALNFRPTPEIMKAVRTTEPNRLPPDDVPREGAAPPVAAEKRPNRRAVWVKKSADEIEERFVETGLGDGVNIVVADGLREGEEVVLSAAFGKRNGNNGQAARNPLMPRRPGR